MEKKKRNKNKEYKVIYVFKSGEEIAAEDFRPEFLTAEQKQFIAEALA